MKTFKATGSWGTLSCDAITGGVVKYKRENSDSEKPGDGYDNIVRLDVEEWRATYPDGDLTAGNNILDFGSWDTEWQYCGPEEDWRFHLWLAPTSISAMVRWGAIAHGWVKKIKIPLPERC